MGTQTVSSWKTAMGAAGDTLRAVGLFPGICALLFGFYVFQGVVSERLKSPGTTETEMIGIAALLFVSGIAAIALTIPLLRTYAGGTSDLTPRVFLRLLGWGAAFILGSVAALGLLVGGVVFLTLLLFGDSGITTVHLVAVYLVVLAAFIPLIWLGLRFSTLWPALALDESSPLLRRSFQETRGYVGYFLLSSICSLVFFIPLMIVSGLVAYVVIGTFYVVGTPQQLSLGAELTLGAINGAMGLFSIVYMCALYGRFFRTVRGIG